MTVKRIWRGPYQSVDEFVERAVSLLHEQGVWLAEHRTEIGAKTEGQVGRRFCTGLGK